MRQLGLMLNGYAMDHFMMFTQIRQKSSFDFICFLVASNFWQQSDKDNVSEGSTEDLDILRRKY